MRRRQHRLAGIAVILAGALVAVLLLLQPNPFAFKRTYWAEMGSAQGLASVGRDIRFAGVNVGTIAGVEREGDHARIELVLRRDVPIHADAQVDLRPHLLFEGSSFVDLHPGSPGAPRLAPGATIPRKQTSTYVTLDKALRILRPRIREDLASLSRSMARTLHGEAIAGVQQTLRSAPSLMRHLKGPARALQGPGRREMAATIAGTARAVDALAENERHLARLPHRLARTAAALATDDAAPLDKALARLPHSLRALRRATPAMTRMIDRLSSFSTSAAPALPALAGALHDVRPVLRRAIPVLREGAPFVADLRSTLRRLARSRTLTEMLRLIPAPLGDLNQLLGTLLEPSRFGVPAYKQVGGMFAGMAGTLRSYQTPSQNPNGWGHGGRANGSLAANLELIGFDALGRAPATTVRRSTPAGSLPCELVRSVSTSAARRLRAAGACG